MKTSTRIIAAAAAALSLGVAGAVFAHQGEGMGMGMHGGGHGRMQGGDVAANATARLAALKAELKITAAQEPAWQQYESVLRRHADARKALHDKMRSQMQDPQAAAGIDRAAQRESMVKLREEHRAERETARQALYAVLTPEQKALADQRTGPGRGRDHRGAMHKRTI